MPSRGPLQLPYGTFTDSYLVINKHNASWESWSMNKFSQDVMWCVDWRARCYCAICAVATRRNRKTRSAVRSQLLECRQRRQPPAPPARGCCHHHHVNSPLKRYLCRLPEILIQLIVIDSTTFSAKRLILQYFGCEEITRSVTTLLKEIRQQRRSVSN